MSHFQFILGITILVITGTLAFTFLHGKDENSPMADNANSSPSHLVESHKSPRSSGNGASSQQRSPSSRSTDNLDVEIAATSLSKIDGAKLAQVNEIIRRTSQDSRQKLEKLTRTYELSAKQRQELFPYIVAHHKQAHPSMLVGGQNIPSVGSDATLDENLHSLLNDDQKAIQAENAIDDDAWWKDVVDQLETDLDAAIEGGEMVAAPDDASDHSGVTVSEAAATGDGAESTHSGGNLFDLLGQ